MRGVFISFEGIEGSGKSSQARLLAQDLRSRGLSVVQTEEPGGTKIGLKIRELLLSLDSREMTPLTELLLYNASRVQHLQEIILPALSRGDIVVTDRFSDSTVAYQGYGRGIDLELIQSLDLLATGTVRPDMTLLLDVDVTTGLERNRGTGKDDRIEREEISFHEKVRKGFLAIAAGSRERVRLIAASAGTDEVRDSVLGAVLPFLGSRGYPV